MLALRPTAFFFPRPDSRCIASAGELRASLRRPDKFILKHENHSRVQPAIINLSFNRTDTDTDGDANKS